MMSELLNKLENTDDQKNSVDASKLKDLFSSKENKDALIGVAGQKLEQGLKDNPQLAQAISKAAEEYIKGRDSYDDKYGSADNNIAYLMRLAKGETMQSINAEGASGLRSAYNQIKDGDGPRANPTPNLNKDKPDEKEKKSADSFDLEEAATDNSKNKTNEATVDKIKNNIDDVKDLDVIKKINITTNIDGNKLLEEIFDGLQNSDKKPLSEQLKKAITELKAFKGEVQKGAVLEKILGDEAIKESTKKALSDLATAIAANESQIKLNISDDAKDAQSQSADQAFTKEGLGNGLSTDQQQLVLDALQTEYGTTEAAELATRLTTTTAFESEARNLIQSYEGLNMGKDVEDKNVIGQVQRYLGELQTAIKASVIENTANLKNTVNNKDPSAQAKEALGENPDINQYNTVIDGAIDSGNGPLVKELFKQRAEFVKKNPDLVKQGTDALATAKAKEKTSEREAVRRLVAAANVGNDEAALMLINKPNLLKEFDLAYKPKDNVPDIVHTRIMIQALLTGNAEAAKELKDRDLIDLGVDKSVKSLTDFMVDGTADQKNADKLGNGKEGTEKGFDGDVGIALEDKTLTGKDGDLSRLGDANLINHLKEKKRDNRKAIKEFLDLEMRQGKLRGINLDSSDKEGKAGFFGLVQKIFADSSYVNQDGLLNTDKINSLKKKDIENMGYDGRAERKIINLLRTIAEKNDPAIVRKLQVMAQAKETGQADIKQLANADNILQTIDKSSQKQSFIDNIFVFIADINDDGTIDLNDKGVKYAKQLDKIINDAIVLKGEEFVMSKIRGLVQSADTANLIPDGVVAPKNKAELFDLMLKYPESKAHLKYAINVLYGGRDRVTGDFHNTLTGNEDVLGGVESSESEEANKLFGERYKQAKDFGKIIEIAEGRRNAETINGKTYTSKEAKQWIKENQELYETVLTIKRDGLDKVKRNFIGSVFNLLDNVQVDLGPNAVEAQKLVELKKVKNMILSDLKQNLIGGAMRLGKDGQFMIGPAFAKKRVSESGKTKINFGGNVKFGTEGIRLGANFDRLQQVNYKRVTEASLSQMISPKYFGPELSAGASIQKGGIVDANIQAGFNFEKDFLMGLKQQERMYNSIGSEIYGSLSDDVIVGMLDGGNEDFKKSFIAQIEKNLTAFGDDPQYGKFVKTNKDRLIANAQFVANYLSSVDTYKLDSLRTQSDLAKKAEGFREMMDIFHAGNVAMRKDEMSRQLHDTVKMTGLGAGVGLALSNAGFAPPPGPRPSGKDTFEAGHGSSGSGSNAPDVPGGENNPANGESADGGNGKGNGFRLFGLYVKARFSSREMSYVPNAIKQEHNRKVLEQGTGFDYVKQNGSAAEYARSIEAALGYGDKLTIVPNPDNTISISTKDGKPLHELVNLFSKADTPNVKYENGVLTMGKVDPIAITGYTSKDTQKGYIVLGAHGTKQEGVSALKSDLIPAEMQGLEFGKKNFDETSVEAIVDQLTDQGLKDALKGAIGPGNARFKAPAGWTPVGTEFDLVRGGNLKLKKGSSGYEVSFVPPVGSAVEDLKITVVEAGGQGETVTGDVFDVTDTFRGDTERALVENEFLKIKPYDIFALRNANLKGFGDMLNQADDQKTAGNLDKAFDFVKGQLQKFSGVFDKIKDLSSNDDKLYVVDKVKQLMAVSDSTALKLVRPSDIAENKSALNELSKSLPSFQSSIDGLINYSGPDYTTEFNKINRENVINENGDAGEKLFFALRPVMDTIKLNTNYASLGNKIKHSEQLFNNIDKVLSQDEIARSMAPELTTLFKDYTTSLQADPAIMNMKNWNPVRFHGIGLSAYYLSYRKGGADNTFGTHFPGEATMIQGSNKPITGENLDTAKKFVGAKLEREPEKMKIMKNTYAEAIKQTMKAKNGLELGSVDLSSQVDKLMKGEEATVTVGDQTITMKPKNEYFAYLMGECANQSIGMNPKFEYSLSGTKEVTVKGQTENSKPGINVNHMEDSYQSVIRENDVTLKGVLKAKLKPEKKQEKPNGKDTFDPGQGSSGNAPNVPTNTPVNTPNNNGAGTSSHSANLPNQGALGGN